MISVNSSKLIIVEYMSHYLVLLILEFLPARLATLPYGLDSNVTQQLANMLTKPSVFYYLPIVPCNLVSTKLLSLLLLLLPEPEQPCAQLSKLICVTACKQAKQTMSHGIVYIPWLVTSYDTYKGKRWLNSNSKPQGCCW